MLDLIVSVSFFPQSNTCSTDSGPKGTMKWRENRKDSSNENRTHKKKHFHSGTSFRRTPYVVSWSWHWLCCSADPLLRCYRPVGTWNRYCCPPNPWWVLMFYSPLSWPHWLNPAFPSLPSITAKHKGHSGYIIPIPDALEFKCKMINKKIKNNYTVETHKKKTTLL